MGRSRLLMCALTVGSVFSGVMGSGCDRIKAMAGGGADGGTAADSAGGAVGGDSLALLDGFEGEIDVSGKSDKTTDAPVALALLIKSGKIRVDIPEELAKSAGPMAANAKGYGLFDSSAKKIYVVLDPSKQIIVVDLNKIGDQVKGFTPPPPPAAKPGAEGPKATPPKVTKTGKYDTVAGYKCENWDVASDHREATVCVAEEGFSWLSLPMSALNGVPTEKMWMADLLDGKHFPLRFIGYGPDGVKESGRIEVTKVDKKPLPASEFELPPTYAQIDLEQMLRGFGAMPGGGMGGGMGGMGGMPVHHK